MGRLLLLCGVACHCEADAPHDFEQILFGETREFKRLIEPCQEMRAGQEKAELLVKIATHVAAEAMVAKSKGVQEVTVLP